jgi:hypothetical protein
MRRFVCCFIFLCILTNQVSHANIFGQVQGIVHDPQHRPVSGTKITIAHCILISLRQGKPIRMVVLACLRFHSGSTSSQSPTLDSLPLSRQLR